MKCVSLVFIILIGMFLAIGIEPVFAMQKTKSAVLLPQKIEDSLRDAGSRQCLLVIPCGSGLYGARIVPLELREDGWAYAFPPFMGVVGKNGFAAPGEKREGDGKTPFGIFAIGSGFGYSENPGFCWKYRQSLVDDIWVDDPEADDYNRLTTKNSTTARSFELMKRPDVLYKFGLVVEYNTDPVQKGFGSAIFIHIWGGPENPTSGCIAFSEERLVEVLRWLDPEKNPKISIYF